MPARSWNSLRHRFLPTRIHRKIKFVYFLAILLRFDDQVLQLHFDTEESLETIEPHFLVGLRMGAENEHSGPGLYKQEVFQVADVFVMILQLYLCLAIRVFSHASEHLIVIDV